MTLQHVLLQLDTSANKAFSIINNSTLNSVILDYATDSTKKGSEMARAILRQVYDTPVYLERPLPGGGGSRLMASQGQAGTVKASQKIKQLGKINQAGEIITGLKVYPNPASNSFTIFYNDNELGEISFSISNPLGNIVSKNTLHRGKACEINAANLNPGLYIVSINNGTSLLAQQKLVIMK